MNKRMGEEIIKKKKNKPFPGNTERGGGLFGIRYRDPRSYIHYM